MEAIERAVKQSPIFKPNPFHKPDNALFPLPHENEMKLKAEENGETYYDSREAFKAARQTGYTPIPLLYVDLVIKYMDAVIYDKMKHAGYRKVGVAKVNWDKKADVYEGADGVKITIMAKRGWVCSKRLSSKFEFIPEVKNDTEN